MMLAKCPNSRCGGVYWTVFKTRYKKMGIYCFSTRGNRTEELGRVKAVCPDCGQESPYTKIYEQDYEVRFRENFPTK